MIFDLATGIVNTNTDVPEQMYADQTRWRAANSQGWMPFRAGLGVTFAVSRYFRFDVLATHSASIPYGGNCPDGCGNVFGYFGLTLGARLGS